MTIVIAQVFDDAPRPEDVVERWILFLDARCAALSRNSSTAPQQTDERLVMIVVRAHLSWIPSARNVAVLENSAPRNLDSTY